MPYKEKTKLKEYKLEYRLKNKEKMKEYQKKYRLTDNYKKSQNKCRRKKRDEVIELLGGKCVYCGIIDFRVLQVDHINGGGSAERKSGAYRAGHSYHVINSIKNDEKKYQLLCANCNWIKRYENKETR